jgi:hypothetical protein
VMRQEKTKVVRGYVCSGVGLSIVGKTIQYSKSGGRNKMGVGKSVVLGKSC